MPQLSVVLPVYNGARFLRSALESILEQNFRDFECIAINDGSTDESPAILEEYQAQDPRVRALHQRNVGLVDTLNRGIASARAPMIARMDADDICLPGRFATQMNYFRGRNDLAVLGGQIQLIDENRKPLRLVSYPIKGRELEAFLEKGSPVAHPAVMLRKAAVEQVGGYRRVFTHAEDYDLWLRVHEAGYAIENLDVPLIEYRQHAENVSVVHRRQQALATVLAQCAHRARLAGLGDPTAELDRPDERAFDLFPARVIEDLGDELFRLRIDTTSFATEQEITGALAAFRRLPQNLQRTRSGTSFLIQVARDALRMGSHSMAAASLARAFSIAPAQVTSIVGHKAARALRSLFEDRVLSGWRRHSVSEKNPAD